MGSPSILGINPPKVGTSPSVVLGPMSLVEVQPRVPAPGQLSPLCALQAPQVISMRIRA